MQYYIKPLERLKEEEKKDSIVNKVHDYLHVDDNDIFHDPYDKPDNFDLEETFNDNYASLPPTVETIRLIQNNFDPEYVSTIRKTRPLPKIPDRTSSKEISKDMTLILSESLKNQNRVSAQQLFQLLSQQNQKDEDEGGVYALKTQVPTVRLSNKDILHDYYQVNSKNAMMTPVEEVDEELLHEEEDDTSSSSTHSRKSFDFRQSDITNLSEPLSSTPPCEYQAMSESCMQSTDSEDDGSFSSPYQSIKLPLENSLSADVRRLSEQNRGLTPNIHSEFSITPSGITHDKEAIKTFRRMATKTNDRHIQFNYARHLIKLVSMTNEDEARMRLQAEAEYWIDKLSKSNYAQALYIKGQWHRQCGSKKFKHVFVGSQYKKVDHDKAFKCFQLAAKYGSVEAYYELAEYWMVRKDYKKSVSFYQYAASKNHIPSLYKLANIMLRGLLQQKKNIAQGLVYLRQAADSKKPECALSAYDYACIISGDLETIDLENDSMILDVCNKHDFRTAIHYLKIADEYGFVNAGFRLGEIYKNGEKGTHIDLWKAYHFFTKAADNHHEGAMVELSKLYRSGIPGCLKPQPSLAYEWCLRAANNGNEAAEYLMGTYLEEGVGIYPDYHQALEWYRKSASKEYEPAQNKLNPSAQTRITSQPRMSEKSINNKRYYQQSIRINEEKSRAHAEQNCRIM